MGQQFMCGGLEANDLFLLASRWCDKSPTLVAILRAAWPDFADPQERGRHHPESNYSVSSRP